MEVKENALGISKRHEESAEEFRTSGRQLADWKAAGTSKGSMEQTAE